MSQATATPPAPTYTSPSSRAARGPSPFMKYVAPALVVGFLLGLFAGVFAGPVLDNWLNRSSLSDAPKGNRATNPNPSGTGTADERTAPPTGAASDPAVPPSDATPTTPTGAPAPTKPAPTAG